MKNEVQTLKTQTMAKHWAAVIHEQKQSGQTVRDWCRDHDIKINRYYYWLNRLRELALEYDLKDTNEPSSDKVVLTEVAVPEPSSSSSIHFQLESCSIDVSNDVDPALLQIIVRALV